MSNMCTNLFKWRQKYICSNVKYMYIAHTCKQKRVSVKRNSLHFIYSFSHRDVSTHIYGVGRHAGSKKGHRGCNIVTVVVLYRFLSLHHMTFTETPKFHLQISFSQFILAQHEWSNISKNKTRKIRTDYFCNKVSSKTLFLLYRYSWNHIAQKLWTQIKNRNNGDVYMKLQKIWF